MPYQWQKSISLSWPKRLLPPSVVAGFVVVALILAIVVDQWRRPAIEQGSTFQSPAYRYAIQLPAGWRTEPQLLSADENVVERVKVHPPSGASLEVLTEREASSDTLIPATPEQHLIKGLKTWWYEDYDPATGAALRRIVIERPDGLVNELRGYGAPLDTLVEGFALN